MSAMNRKIAANPAPTQLMPHTEKWAWSWLWLPLFALPAIVQALPKRCGGAMGAAKLGCRSGRNGGNEAVGSHGLGYLHGCTPWKTHPHICITHHKAYFL